MRTPSNRAADQEIDKSAIVNFPGGDLTAAYLEKYAASQADHQDSSQVLRLDEVRQKAISWLWEKYIPQSQITIIDGDPGAGKSWVTLAISAAVSTGSPLPGELNRRQPGKVLLACEDDPATIVVPRLKALDADLSQISQLRFSRDFSILELEMTVRALRPRLIVIDPIQELLAVIGEADSNNAVRMRGVLSGLQQIAQNYETSIVIVRHLRKSGSDHPLYRGLGSIDFVAVARSVLLVGSSDGERAIAPIKCSYAPLATPITVRIDDNGFAWVGPSPRITAESLLAPHESPSKLSDAIRFLKAELADGPRPSQEILEAAEAEGIASATLRRAKANLGIVAEPRRTTSGQRVRGWVWRLPDNSPSLYL